MSSPLDNLAGAGGSLVAEPPDRNEFNGLKKSGLARLHDAANATLSLALMIEQSVVRDLMP